MFLFCAFSAATVRWCWVRGGAAVADAEEDWARFFGVRGNVAVGGDINERGDDNELIRHQ